jgi:hypothetical protein
MGFSSPAIVGLPGVVAPRRSLGVTSPFYEQTVMMPVPNRVRAMRREDDSVKSPNGQQFDINKYDIANTAGFFKVQHSCKDIAKVINSILAQKRCCYRVSCNPKSSNEAGMLDLSPDEPIDPIFR